MVTETIGVVANVTEGAVNTLDRLGVLEKLSQKLVSRPDPAAKHLARVILEIESVYRELEMQIMDLSLLEFEPPKELRRTRTKLRRLQTYGLRKQIKHAQNSCKLIKSIHRRFLTGWFSRVLSKRQAESLNLLFDEMSILDESLVSMMATLSLYLERVAKEILTAIDANDAKKAREYVRSQEKRFDVALRKLNHKLQSLSDLKGRFMAASGAL